METLRYLAIEFLDGKRETFTFPAQTQDSGARKLRFADFLQGQFVIVQLDQEIQLFPISAIRSIRVSGFSDAPDGSALPPYAIRGAEQH
ncbi:hypothetical protein [Niveibacterium sp. SC-1]|uniref:hypothetical protein n=1 Tax=Niveibacterium sp. SC-1 TaxID=3135646 RepID=UPI00311DFD0E